MMVFLWGQPKGCPLPIGITDQKSFLFFNCHLPVTLGWYTVPVGGNMDIQR